MYTNEAGLKVYEIGDVVRIGTGRVHWQVTFVGLGQTAVVVESLNTGKEKTEVIERLTLVQDVRTTDEWKAANEAPAEEPVKETTSYQKAVLFALNRLGKHVYAGTVSKTKKAKTRKLNLRQKASRKANR